MANVKFSDFAVRTTVPTVDYIVGYQGAANIQIAPTDFLGDYLPLAGGTMIGDVVYNDSVKAKFGTGADSELYHTGSHLFFDNAIGTSYIRNTAAGGTGILLRNSVIGDIQFDNEFAGNILFNTSNVERMRIDSTGNIGIGTISPSRKLDVRDSSDSQSTVLAYNQGASFTGTVYEAITDRVANSAFNLMNLKASTVSKFLVRGDGNVGISTDSPTARLDVRAAQGDMGAYFFTAHNSAVSDGHVYINSDQVLAPFTALKVRQAGTGPILLLTGTAAAGEVLRVTSGGDVGIGDAAPNTKLEVNGDTTIRREGSETSGELLLGGTTDGGFVDFDSTNLQLNTQRDPNTGTFINAAKSQATIQLLGPTGGSSIKFGTAAADNTVSTTRMTINKDGNLGLGTTTPSVRLQVSGTTASNLPQIEKTQSSTTVWTTILTFTGTEAQAYSVLLSTGENNYSQMWRVSGSVLLDTCYFTILGDSGHVHSKDAEFQLTSGGELQYKNIAHTSARVLYVFDVVQSRGSFSYT